MGHLLLAKALLQADEERNLIIAGSLQDLLNDAPTAGWSAHLTGRHGGDLPRVLLVGKDNELVRAGLHSTVVLSQSMHAVGLAARTPQSTVRSRYRPSYF